MKIFKKIYLFYYHGFRNMTIGKTLWVIIFVKLFIMFAILKFFFFPDHLKNYKTESDKANYVLDQLTNPK